MYLLGLTCVYEDTMHFGSYIKFLLRGTSIAFLRKLWCLHVPYFS